MQTESPARPQCISARISTPPSSPPAPRFLHPRRLSLSHHLCCTALLSTPGLCHPRLARSPSISCHSSTTSSHLAFHSTFLALPLSPSLVASPPPSHCRFPSSSTTAGHYASVVPHHLPSRTIVRPRLTRSCAVFAGVLNSLVPLPLNRPQVGSLCTASIATTAV